MKEATLGPPESYFVAAAEAASDGRSPADEPGGFATLDKRLLDGILGNVGVAQDEAGNPEPSPTAALRSGRTPRDRLPSPD